MNETGKEAAVPVIKPALEFATKTFQENFLFLMGVFYVAMSLIQAVCALFDAHIIPVIYSSFFAGGVLIILLSYCRGEQPNFSLLTSKTRQFWKFLVGYFLFFLMCTIGFILLIVPGIILAVRFGFYPLAIAEKDLGPIAAFKYSWEITRGKFWKLLLFGITTVAILILPALILGVAAGALTKAVTSVVQVERQPVANAITALLLPVLGNWFQLCWVNCYWQLTRGSNTNSPVQVAQ
jgi:hypothetical protein